MSHRGAQGPRADGPIQRLTCSSRADSASSATRSARAASEWRIRKLVVSRTCQFPTPVAETRWASGATSRVDAVAGAGAETEPGAPGLVLRGVATARAGPPGV